MATYCFTCPTCGTTRETVSREVQVCPQLCDEMVRDYRAESVGVSIRNLRQEREHTVAERAAGMLPSNEDYKSASDPDGTKGIREWRETHNPAPGNKRPYWPGSVEKKTF